MISKERKSLFVASFILSELTLQQSFAHFLTAVAKNKDIISPGSL